MESRAAGSPFSQQLTLSPEHIQRLCHIAEDIRDHLRDLTDHYRDFVRVIKAENAHLKLHGPFDLEDIIRQKTAIGQSLELAVTELYHCRQKLRAFTDRLRPSYRKPPSEAHDAFTLSRLYDQLSQVAAGQKDAQLQNVLHDTKTALDILLRVQSESSQQVKLNAYVIEKMLEQHTQVIDLWQSVIDSSESTYSKKGVKAKSGSTAILRAKA